MKFVDSKHPAGTIGYWTGWHPRFFQFYDSLSPLIAPTGSKVTRVQGPSSVSGANKLIQMMEGEWLWMIPDDHTFEPDVLMQLLDRNVDVVAPRVCIRAIPFNCVGFKKFNEKDGSIQYTWKEVGQAYLKNELLPCEAIGGAGLLIRKGVKDKVDFPYFTAVLPDGVSEDIEFTRHLFEAGFNIWLDPRAALTHIVEAALIPIFDEQTGEPSMGAEVFGRRLKISL